MLTQYASNIVTLETKRCSPSRALGLRSAVTNGPDVMIYHCAAKCFMIKLTYETQQEWAALLIVPLL